MSKYMYRLISPLALSAALIMGACVDKKADTLAEDTSLNRDLQMANQDTAAQPALQDVPATGAPSTQPPVASAPSRAATRTPPRSSI